MKVKFGGKEHDVSDEIGNAIKDMAKKLKDTQDANDELTDALKAVDDMGMTKGNKKADSNENDDADNSKVAELQAKLDAANDELEKYDEIVDKIDDEDELKARVKEYTAVHAIASRIVPKDKLDDLDGDVEAIKRAVILSESPNVKKDRLDSEHYLNARFDMITEAYNKSDKQKEKIGKAINKDKDDRTKKTDESKNDAESVRLASIERQKQYVQDRMDELAKDNAA